MYVYVTHRVICVSSERLMQEWKNCYRHVALALLDRTIDRYQLW